MAKFRPSPVAGMLAFSETSRASKPKKEQDNPMSISNGKRIRWTPEEMQTIADEARRKFPGEEKITIDNFLECQNVLPFERRRPSINYSTKCKLLEPVKAKPAKRSDRGKAEESRGHTKYRRRANGEALEVVPAAPANAPVEISADGFVDSLSRQIESVVIGVSAKALELAAQRLLANMPPTPA